MGSREAVGPKTKRPCARLRDADRICRSAPGDPAMVLMFRMASILSSVSGILPCPAAGLLLDVTLRMTRHSRGDHGLVHDRFRESKAGSSGRSCENAPNGP